MGFPRFCCLNCVASQLFRLFCLNIFPLPCHFHSFPKGLHYPYLEISVGAGTPTTDEPKNRTLLPPLLRTLLPFCCVPHTLLLAGRSLHHSFPKCVEIDRTFWLLMVFIFLLNVLKGNRFFVALPLEELNEK